MSAADVRTLMEAAADAIGADDYTTAKRKARQAYAHLLALPNAGRGQASLSWDRESIQAFIADIQIAETEAIPSNNGTPVRQNLTYTGVTDDA